LYLRKALHIKEKQLELMEFKPKYTNEPVLAGGSFASGTLTDTAAISSKEESHLILNRNDESQMDTTSKDASKDDEFKLGSGEDENMIAEILFDLGCLLGTYESLLSKREAIDCLQRALDIKVLIQGPTHGDIVVIKKKLNEISCETAQLASLAKSAVASSRLDNFDDNLRALLNRSTIRSTTASSSASVKSYSVSSPSPRKILDKYVSNLNEQMCAGTGRMASGSSQLNNWIEKNSIIEVIPLSRRNKNNLKQHHQQRQLQEQLQQQQQQRKLEIEMEKSTTASTKSNEFLQTSIYTEESLVKGARTLESTNPIEQESNRTFSNVEPAVYSLLKAKQSFSSSATGLNNQKTQSQQVSPPQRSSLLLKKSMSMPKHSSSNHLSNCKCPTALSIDVHNVRSVHGPNSSLKKLMDTNQTPEEMRNTSRSKILRKVYYKTAWYDLPAGSSRTRFKNFVKLTPNA
jgi:hypothetical protein